MKKQILILGVLCLGLAACASSGPTISASASPDVNLSDFETFNYMPRLGTDRPNGTRTPLSSRLIEAMNHEMSQRGLRLSDTPDLVVDFMFVTQERVDVRTTPSHSMSAHRSHWGRHYSVWPTYQTTVRQYTVGTFLIDLIDVENAALIAEGAAQGRMLSDMQSMPQGDVNAVVADIMAQLMP